MSLTKNGYFEFIDYFSSKSVTTKLTIVSISSISELMAEQIDVYNLVYRSNDVPVNVFAEHVSKDIDIITLRDGDRSFIIPEPYLKRKSEVEYVDYQKYGVTINLGELSASEIGKINLLKDSILSTIKDLYGINAGVTLVPYGKVSQKESSVDKQIQVARLLERTLGETLVVKNAKLSGEVVRLENIIYGLKDIIKKKIIT